MVYRDRSIWIMPYLCKACYFILLMKGMSANADPHYQKLYGRVTDVCSNRRGQPNLCAMIEPRPGRNPYLIRFAPPSGKYALNSDFLSSHTNAFQELVDWRGIGLLFKTIKPKYSNTCAKKCEFSSNITDFFFSPPEESIKNQ